MNDRLPCKKLLIMTSGDLHSASSLFKRLLLRGNHCDGLSKVFIGTCRQEAFLNYMDVKHLCMKGWDKNCMTSSDILVLKIILVLVFIQFWVNNFYFSFSFSFEIILVFISVLVSVST